MKTFRAHALFMVLMATLASAQTKIDPTHQITVTPYSVLVAGASLGQWATPTANLQCFMGGASSYATTIPSFQTCPPPALSVVTGSAAQTTGTESAAGDNYTFAGVETGNFTAYLSFTDANSTNNHTNLGLLAGVTGSSTGGIGALIYDVSGTGDILQIYSGGSISNGVYTPGTLESHVGANGEGYFGAGAPNPTVGTAGGFAASEGTAPTATSAVDICYADSTSHQILCSYNGGSFFPVELDAISTQTTAYSAAVTDSTILCNSTAGFTVTLVTSGIPTGKTYHIKNENVGTCTISANIDNVTSYPLTQYQAITVKFDGVQYWIF